MIPVELLVNEPIPEKIVVPVLVLEMVPLLIIDPAENSGAVLLLPLMLKLPLFVITGLQLNRI